MWNLDRVEMDLMSVGRWLYDAARDLLEKYGGSKKPFCLRW